jgi:hypothetical protein
MKTSILKKGLILADVAFVFQACSSDDNNTEDVHDEELITTIRVSLPAGGNTITLVSRDLDGPEGPNEPVIDISGPLATNTTYNGSISLLNESENPAENITEEIEEEDEEHQFFFSTSGSVTGTDYDDQDADGNPVGLSFTLTTGAAGNGTFGLVLRHEPKKPNDGTLADAGGATDIDQTFNVAVQ